jgi:hypothetical protein
LALVPATAAHGATAPIVGDWRFNGWVIRVAGSGTSFTGTGVSGTDPCGRPIRGQAVWRITGSGNSYHGSGAVWQTSPSCQRIADRAATWTLSSPTSGRYCVTGFPCPSQNITKVSSSTPTISIADARVREGDRGLIRMRFNVTLSEAADRAVTVRYTTHDGSAARAPGDYHAKSGELRIAAGATSAPIDVDVVGDTEVEGDESFSVVLSNPTNATLLDSVARGTIEDDEPKLSIHDTSTPEGDTGTHPATFTVSLSRATTSDVTVRFSTENGSASGGQFFDYLSRSDTLTIRAGRTTGTISISIKGDTVIEGNETFFVALAEPRNASLDDPRGTGTIRDDDNSGPGGTPCYGQRPTIVGTDRADVIEGTPGRDVIAALGGDDTVRSIGGNDLVCLGAGNDRFGFADHFARSDTLSVDGGTGNDTIAGHRGGAGAGAGRDLLQGGIGNDDLFGGFGVDRAQGGPGQDEVDTRFNDPNDTADGGDGVDHCVTDPADTRISC